MTNNKNLFIEVTPNKICLAMTPDESCYESQLTLRNLTNEHVAYKVFINRTAMYSSNPSVGFLNPNHQTVVKIKKLLKTDQQDTKVDKFMVVAVTSKTPITMIEEAKSLITKDTAKAPTSQIIVLETDYETQNLNNVRSTMKNNTGSGAGLEPNAHQANLRSSLPVNPFNGINLQKDKENENENAVKNTRTSTSGANNVTQPTVSGEYIIEHANKDEMRKLIDDTKRSIVDVKNDVDKFNNNLQNILISKNKLKTKIEVLSDRTTVTPKQTFSSMFLIFMITIGLIAGGFLRKTIHE